MIAFFCVFSLIALLAETQSLYHTGMLDIGEYRVKGNHIFYWLDKSESSDPSVPLVLWLEGGPGASGMIGRFFINGPETLSESLETIPRKHSWTKHMNMLYLDSPVGTGFSYVRNTSSGYAENECDVALDLYGAIMEFYRIHPEYAEKSFYIAGESYGGHYIPSLATFILGQNANFSVPNARTVNLKGVSIGDSFIDPCSQIMTKPTTALSFGLVDFQGFKHIQAIASQAQSFCQQNQFLQAASLREQLEDFVLSTSGINPYDVRTFQSYQFMDVRLAKYLNSPVMREKLGVGDHLWSTDTQVAPKLLGDKMKSYVSELNQVLSANLRVLLYQGQFDWKDGSMSNEQWIDRMVWEYQREFLATKRLQWVTNSSQVSGWFKAYGGLTEVVVNDAGHMTPMNQPSRMLELMYRFIHNIPLDSISSW